MRDYSVKSVNVRPLQSIKGRKDRLTEVLPYLELHLPFPPLLTIARLWVLLIHVSLVPIMGIQEVEFRDPMPLALAEDNFRDIDLCVARHYELFGEDAAGDVE